MDPQGPIKPRVLGSSYRSSEDWRSETEPISASASSFLSSAMTEAIETPSTPPWSLKTKRSQSSISTCSSGTSWKSLSTIHPGWNEPPRPFCLSDSSPTRLAGLDPPSHPQSLDIERTGRCLSGSVSSASWQSLSSMRPSWDEPYRPPHILAVPGQEYRSACTRQATQPVLEWKPLIPPRPVTQLTCDDSWLCWDHGSMREHLAIFAPKWIDSCPVFFRSRGQAHLSLHFDSRDEKK
ncbi:uncharacterized protein PV07_11267 [Cladophialophora immunda]|uniref:Uncharacterized protein n=1 Tax=Cladophialophora immunda TaxID=569365 RepID=A0A0D2BXK4_9EURO|nr:uncharacterized protein PV07_11267 [Cladophialophora immunda]KIW23035.1 hypothetical protein PV07_11267 [Cladophialophora immunda]